MVRSIFTIYLIFRPSKGTTRHTSNGPCRLCHTTCTTSKVTFPHSMALTAARKTRTCSPTTLPRMGLTTARTPRQRWPRLAQTPAHLWPDALELWPASEYPIRSNPLPMKRGGALCAGWEENLTCFRECPLMLASFIFSILLTSPVSILYPMCICMHLSNVHT